MAHRAAISKTGILVVIAIILVILIGLGVTGPNSGTLGGSTQSGATTTSSSVGTSEISQSTSSNLWPVLSLQNGSATCTSIGELPDLRCTPGAVNSNVTQSNIDSTICVSGWTQTVRPPTSYTEPLKYKSIQEYGYKDTNVSHYEEDHLIPLELGGSPTSVYNLWAQPHYGNYTSYDKDALENYLNHLVCSGKMSLVQAQQDIETNWVKYYLMYEQNSVSTT